MATPSEPATRPAVTINRDAAVSFPDRALVYKILLDDAVAGEIHAGERHPLDVTCGRHTLQVRAGRSFRSPVVEFEVGDEPVTFACGPSPRLNAVTLEGDLLLDLIASAVGLPPDDHLWLRPADRASVEPGAGADQDSTPTEEPDPGDAQTGTAPGSRRRSSHVRLMDAVNGQND